MHTGGTVGFCPIIHTQTIVTSETLSDGVRFHVRPVGSLSAQRLQEMTQSRIAKLQRTLPANVAVQGNLDPVLLNTTPEIVRREAARLLEAMRGSAGHIFNLGHGIQPHAKLECMEALVETVTTWKN